MFCQPSCFYKYIFKIAGIILKNFTLRIGDLVFRDDGDEGHCVKGCGADDDVCGDSHGVRC